LPYTTLFRSPISGARSPVAAVVRRSVRGRGLRQQDPQEQVDHELRPGEDAGEEEEQPDRGRPHAETLRDAAAHPRDDLVLSRPVHHGNPLHHRPVWTFTQVNEGWGAGRSCGDPEMTLISGSGMPGDPGSGATNSDLRRLSGHIG